MGIHSSHTASDEGGWRDPHACLGHLQFMKGTCSTCTINIIMHISQAPCRNQTVGRPGTRLLLTMHSQPCRFIDRHKVPYKSVVSAEYYMECMHNEIYITAV